MSGIKFFYVPSYFFILQIHYLYLSIEKSQFMGIASNGYNDDIFQKFLDEKIAVTVIDVIITCNCQNL